FFVYLVLSLFLLFHVSHPLSVHHSFPTRRSSDLLLDVTKEEIRNYQTAHKVPYYEDESNAENHYVRNDIRNRILPDIEANQHLSDRKSTRLDSSHVSISYAVFCLKKKKNKQRKTI